MFSNALHEDLMRLGLAPNRSLANVRKMPLKRPENARILQATRIVRFPEFYEKAVRVFTAIADAIQALPGKDVFLFVQENKSNEWLAALFVDFLKRTGKSELATRVSLTDDAMASNGIVVFLDDATYSGNQMVDFLSEFMPNIEQSLVIVGIPFVTMLALNKIRDELEVQSDRVSSMILYADVLEPLSKRSSSSLKPAIYFDHKVPDDVSTYSTYDHYLDPNAVLPFYKEPNWSPFRSIQDRSRRVSLNASRIPAPQAITIELDASSKGNQKNRRQLISYDDFDV